MKPPLLVVLGPTASGKSDLAVRLAKKFNGEVVSADSRQVYTGLNLGTGKITKREMRSVPHHLLDISSPKKVITVAKYQELAHKIITDIHTRGKLPILCGGTGFYIQAVVDNIIFPDVPPNPLLRKKLEKMDPHKLYLILKELDPRRALQINPTNHVKIIRAIEIAKLLGKVPRIKTESKYTTLQIGIETPDQVLKNKIERRILSRLKNGMIREVKNLHKSGLSWKRMIALGLEYRSISHYLQDKLSKSELIEKLKNETWQYVRRQKTWFKRDKRILWLSLEKEKEMIEAVKHAFKKRRAD